MNDEMLTIQEVEVFVECMKCGENQNKTESSEKEGCQGLDSKELCELWRVGREEMLIRLGEMP